MLRRGVVVAGLLLAAALGSEALAAENPNDRVSRGTVTIITDGLAQSSGFVTSLAAEVASAVDEEGRIRLLPVMGYGAEANVRDMLYLRGIDLGILNSDTLEYLRLEGKLPTAQSRLKLVARLFDKRVFLLARDDVTDITSLAGKEVLAAGSDGEARVTARTLFSLSGIEVKLREQDPEAGLAEILNGSAAAMLLIARDAAWLNAHVPPGAALRLLHVPSSARIAEVYETAAIEPSEVPALAASTPVETLRLASVLATFDWRSSHSRYLPVGNLIKALYGIVASVRRSGAGGIWSEMRPDADVPGWERYGPSAELARSMPEPSTPVAASAAAAASPLPEVPAPAPSLPPTVTITAQPTPGLVGESLPNHGLLVALLSAALEGRKGTDAVIELSHPGMTDRASISFPVLREDCAGAESGEIAKQSGCEGQLLSEPVLTVPNVLFVRKGTSLAIRADTDIAGRSLCVAEDADIGRLLGARRHWQSEQLVTIVTMPQLAACFAAVSRGDIDAALASDLDGRAAIAGLGIADELEIVDDPVSLTSLAVAVPEEMPAAQALLAHVNAALASLASSGRKAEIVAAHLAPLLAEPGVN